MARKPTTAPKDDAPEAQTQSPTGGLEGAAPDQPSQEAQPGAALPTDQPADDTGAADAPQDQQQADTQNDGAGEPSQEAAAIDPPQHLPELRSFMSSAVTYQGKNLEEVEGKVELARGNSRFGVVTKVSPEQLAYLKRHSVFQIHQLNGSVHIKE